MSSRSVPAVSISVPRAAAASADQFATQAALDTFGHGGNAIDAAIAANAVLAVTAPHLCGLGGDLFALVHDGRQVHALDASGRAGSGVDAEAMRAEGLTSIPLRHHPAAVTVPGCVDGWTTLHEHFGRLPMGQVLETAIALATDGFPASPLLAGSLALVDDESRRNLRELAEQATARNAVVRRPGIARTLAAIGAGGRSAMYQGEFGDGLAALTGGMITADDLAGSQADWVQALSTDAFGVTLHTIPPASQGFLTLGGAIAADVLGLPDDPDSRRWLELTLQAAVLAGHDRPAVLHEGADGDELLGRIAQRARSARPGELPPFPAPAAGGDTTYLCTAERGGLAVSLIQSNASGFGSGLVEPSTNINLQNRGLGFSLQPGHPAELAPGRRPPHTLCPTLATWGAQRCVFGTMGGDAQPQVLLQLAARLFVHGEHVGAALAAPRWVLRGPRSGFDTWDGESLPAVIVEGHAPDEWSAPGRVGPYESRRSGAFTSEFGHAHVIVDDGTLLHTAADPRTVVGSAAGR